MLMNLIGSTLERTFLVKYLGKRYNISYLNSDYSNSRLINRANWEILDEDGEEINIYCFKSCTKREKKQIELNIRKFEILVKFCIDNFNFYQPAYRK